MEETTIKIKEIKKMKELTRIHSIKMKGIKYIAELKNMLLNDAFWIPDSLEDYRIYVI